MTRDERILIQLNKLLRLCDEEGYNNETLNPARNLLKEMREEMNVQRISGGKIEYREKANGATK